MTTQSTLIVGVGSPHGDDQAGWLVVQRLAEAGLGEKVSVEQARYPAELFNWLDGFERLFVCDACQGLSYLGEVRRWNWPNAEIAQTVWSGTHNLALPAVLELAQRTKRLPPEVVLWAIEGRPSRPLDEVSPEVLAAVPSVAQEMASAVTGAS